jgi:alpha-ribazole phosphatase
MNSVLFIRHGETEMAGRFCGQSDPELNARGCMQLGLLAELLAAETIDKVYSSDLRRARSTAYALATAHGVAVELRPALREIHFGQWEGLSWEQIEGRDPDYAREWMAAYPDLPAPGGETFAAFEARVLEEVNQLVDDHRGPIAVVTHAGVLRVVLRRLRGCSDAEAWDQTQAYCCVVRHELEAIGENK